MLLCISILEDLRDASYNDFLIYGAQLCKSNSKYKNYNNLKICYTSLKNIKKTQKIGEVIIIGKKNIIKL